MICCAVQVREYSRRPVAWARVPVNRKTRLRVLVLAGLAPTTCWPCLPPYSRTRQATAEPLPPSQATIFDLPQSTWQSWAPASWPRLPRVDEKARLAGLASLLNTSSTPHPADFTQLSLSVSVSVPVSHYFSLYPPPSPRSLTPGPVWLDTHGTGHCTVSGRTVLRPITQQLNPDLAATNPLTLGRPLRLINS